MKIKQQSVAENQKMAKKNKNFSEWQENEWGTVEDYRKDGKRYNPKKEAVKQQRFQRTNQKNKFFDPNEK